MKTTLAALSAVITSVVLSVPAFAGSQIGNNTLVLQNNGTYQSGSNGALVIQVPVSVNSANSGSAKANSGALGLGLGVGLGLGYGGNSGYGSGFGLSGAKADSSVYASPVTTQNVTSSISQGNSNFNASGQTSVVHN